jgi:hypothetical protein
MAEENPTQSQILLYQTEDGRERIEVRLENGTVWLSQMLLAELSISEIFMKKMNFHQRELLSNT